MMTTDFQSSTFHNEAVLFDSLLNKQFGSTTVKRFESGIRENEEGEMSTFVELYLSAPEGETWPSQDVVAIRSEIVKLISATAYGLNVYVRFIASETR